MRDPVDALAVEPADTTAAAQAQARWNTIAKPIGSLGLLEDAVTKMAALTGDPTVDISKRCVVVLCADNGVVDAGVSQCGQEVTLSVARNLACGTSSVCRMAQPFGIDCVPVDVGMRAHPAVAGLRDRCIAPGTADITCGPAMTRADVLRAVGVGIDLVGELVEEGYGLVATGEMGIGNTTTATAVACALCDLDPRDVTGRGAGLSDAGLRRKTNAIQQALALNSPDPHDPLDVLAKVGGFDLAALCGMFLGAAVHRVPLVIDGLISCVAALCAVRLRPACAQALLASHRPVEPSAHAVMEELGRAGLRPLIDAGLRLGEGTGAVCLVPLLDMALSLYRNGSTFAGSGIEPYEVSPR